MPEADGALARRLDAGIEVAVENPAILQMRADAEAGLEDQQHEEAR